MFASAVATLIQPASAWRTTTGPKPKSDWPLMSDTQTIRAGVPEALLLWRRAAGEPDPSPSDPDILPR